MLRARSPAGIAQEVYALLTCYQIVRIAITDAIEAAGGIDPDRGSFTIALNAARDLLTQAANVITGSVVDLIGALGRRVQVDRHRHRDRKTKARPGFPAGGPRLATRTAPAQISVCQPLTA